MEKISRIVRGSPRVASVDLKNAAPVRAGAPSFGRPVSESTSGNDRGMTTAARAVAIHNEMNEMKKAASQDKIVEHMADQFFMTRIRRPEEPRSQVVESPLGAEPPGVEAPGAEGPVADMEAIEADSYKPRGSYIDVRA